MKTTQTSTKYVEWLSAETMHKNSINWLSDLEFMKQSGYVTQSLAIQTAQEVGFKLVASSEINANPKDTRDHPRGVWTLPPSFRLKDQDREKYAAIGESDRMTLLFKK